MTNSPDSLLSSPIVDQLAQLINAVRDRAPAGGDLLEALLTQLTSVNPDPSHGINPVLPIVHGENVLFIAESEAPVSLLIEDGDREPMVRVPGTSLWVRATRLAVGRTYNYAMWVGDEPLGDGLSPHAVATYHSLSYPLAEAPRGELLERAEVTSKIYEGSTSEYWIYTNPGIDERRDSPLMVWLDGRAFLGATDALALRVQTVTDNLVHLGRMPPTTHLFLTAGTRGSNDPPAEAFHTGFYDPRVMQFDEASDRYSRYLREEVLPIVGAKVKLRDDSYSRAIFGGSSGGTCAFTVGWFASDLFSRVCSYLASFTAVAWRPGDGVDGANVLPLWVRREPRRNLRVWFSDGELNEWDTEAPAHLGYTRGLEEFFAPVLHDVGSQTLGSFEMAQALKTKGYDFHFRYGQAGHNHAQGALDLPEALTWLWRDYDPERTSQTYEPDGEERSKPPYKFGVINRDVW